IGLVNYREGGGGVLEGIVLRGGLNGVVGHSPSAGGPTGGGVANSLHVRDVVITDTGRGVLWHAGADLTGRDTRIAPVRRNGVVLRPLGSARAGPQLLDVAA